MSTLTPRERKTRDLAVEIIDSHLEAAADFLELVEDPMFNDKFAALRANLLAGYPTDRRKSDDAKALADQAAAFLLGIEFGRRVPARVREARRDARR